MTLRIFSITMPSKKCGHSRGLEQLDTEKLVVGKLSLRRRWSQRRRNQNILLTLFRHTVNLVWSQISCVIFYATWAHPFRNIRDVKRCLYTFELLKRSECSCEVIYICGFTQTGTMLKWNFNYIFIIFVTVKHFLKEFFWGNK